MIKSEILLNTYIRPYVYALVEVCADESTDLAHVWELGIEKYWSVTKHKSGELFAYAYIYLSGFYDRHSKKVLGKEEIEKEFEQFFYLFEIALKEFGSFQDEILFVLHEATLKIKNKLKISKFYIRCKKLMEKKRYEEPIELKEELESKIHKTQKPIEEKITEKIDKEGGKTLTSEEVRELTERWTGETSKVTPPKKEPKPPKHSPPKPGPKQSRTLEGYAKFLIVFLIIILALFFLFETKSQQPVQEEIITPEVKNQTETEVVMIDISFEKYIDNIEEYVNKKVTITGYLRREIEGTKQSGVYVESLVDDFDNQILLSGITGELREHFEKIGTTTIPYEVSGRFKKEYGTIKLVVDEIKKGEFPSKIVTHSKITTEEVKEASQGNKSFDFDYVIEKIKGFLLQGCTDGTKYGECSEQKPFYCKHQQLIKNPDLCGCPKGERVFKDECVPTIRCKDGTLHPECSKTKKMQCLEGSFVLTPICGCPDSYVIKDNKCLKTCSDETPYGYCSENKPMYCSDGKLIKKVSECGCISGYYPENNDCFEKIELMEKKVLEYTNRERKSRDVSELEWDTLLAKIARAHSEDMKENNYFSHINPQGENPSARASRMEFNRRKQLGGGWYTEGIAENIGGMSYGNVMGHGYVSNTPEGIAKAQVESWMDSPGHRENILNPQYTHLGVGIAYVGPEYLLTQNFW